MRLVLVGIASEYVLCEDASGVTFDDVCIYGADGVEIAAWAFSDGGVEGWFPSAPNAPEDFFSKAELRGGGANARLAEVEEALQGGRAAPPPTAKRGRP